jgi:transcriptional regulator with XRE-family HTH domain
MGFRENLKLELEFSGLLVKELADKSGVNIHSINHYLSAKSKIPGLDIGVKLAKVLGVSAEYLITGEDTPNNTTQRLSNTSRHIAQLAEQLDDKKKAFVMEFIKLLLPRKDGS